MARLLIVGSVTRDYQRLRGRRWSQPGGAPWHAALALTPGAGVTVVAQAGPWTRRYARPGLVAAGVEWAGDEATADTVFENRYADGGLEQVVRSIAPPITATMLCPGPFDGGVVSPLVPEDVAADVVGAVADRCRFVALDVQGLARRVDARGRVRLGRYALRPFVAGVHTVKFARKEFEAFIGGPASAPGAADLARSLRAEVLITDGERGSILTTADGTHLTAEGASLGDAADTTGAGDVLIAAYVAERSVGRPASAALEAATALTTTLLRRRAGAAARSAEVVPLLRQIEARALVAGRRRGRGASAAIFEAPSALTEGLAAHLGAAPEPAGTDVEDGAGALLSGCAALLSRGWPDDVALAPAALRRVVEAADRLRPCSSG